MVSSPLDDKTLTGCKPVDSGEIPSKETSFRSRLEETSFGLVQVIFKGETNKKSEIEEKSGGHEPPSSSILGDILVTVGEMEIQK